MLKTAHFLLLLVTFLGGSDYAAAGGVTGGGGNLLVDYLPKHPLSSEYVERKIHGLKPTVLLWMEGKEKSYLANSLPESEMALFTPIFQSQPVRAALDPVPVVVRRRQPCLGEAGRAFDGSASSANADTVCMSAPRIAAKVDRFALVPQASALMVHEFSELMGATDTEAYALQAIALREFSAAWLNR